MGAKPYYYTYFLCAGRRPVPRTEEESLGDETKLSILDYFGCLVIRSLFIMHFMHINIIYIIVHGFYSTHLSKLHQLHTNKIPMTEHFQE